MHMCIEMQCCAVFDAGRHKHDIHHLNKRMVVVVVGVPVSTAQLELALAQLQMQTEVKSENNMAVAEIDSPCQDLYEIFVDFRNTHIWPALLADGKYKYYSGDEWLNINEIMVTL